MDTRGVSTTIARYGVLTVVFYETAPILKLKPGWLTDPDLQAHCQRKLEEATQRLLLYAAELEKELSDDSPVYPDQEDTPKAIPPKE